MVKRKSRPSMMQKTALCAMLLMLTVIGYTMLMFALHIPMSAYNAVVPVAGIAVYSVLFDRKMLRSLVICLVVLIIWAIICSKIFDWSYDGMYYHKQAVITLAEGWNPLYESSAAAQPLNSNANLLMWLDNYPKGVWICSAAIYIVTDFLETAKSVNILFILMLFCLAYSTFRTVFGAGRIRAGIFAAASCINPVFISQLFTSYNDLAVGVLIISAAFIGMKIYSRRANMSDYALLFCVTAMSCLVKFTAPLLVGLVLIAYGIGYAIKLSGVKIALPNFIKSAKNAEGFAEDIFSEMKSFAGNVLPKRFGDVLPKFKKPAIFILSGFLIGTVLLGFDPYIKHIANGQNLVYPVLGENSYDIMNTNPPEGLYNKPEFVKYFLALASQTSNNINEKYKLKIPFTAHAGELDYISNADTRLGGFGVWFSGIFLLAILAAAWASFILHRKMKREIMILLITFLALGLFFPEAWWARYASYTFYIPLFLLFYASEQPIVRPAAYATVLMIAVNSFINTVCVVRDGREVTDNINVVLNDIKAQNKRIEVRINDFPSHLKLFEETGIPYVIAPDSISDETVFYRDTKYRFID